MAKKTESKPTRAEKNALTFNVIAGCSPQYIRRKTFRFIYTHYSNSTQQLTPVGAKVVKAHPMYVAFLALQQYSWEVRYLDNYRRSSSRGVLLERGREELSIHQDGSLTYQTDSEGRMEWRYFRAGKAQ